MAKALAKRKGKGEPMECTVCKGMHRTSMAKGTGPIPYLHDYKKCEHSRRIWQEKLKMEAQMLQEKLRQGGGKVGGKS